KQRQTPHLEIPSFRQRPSFCGPASLKLVLSYFGIEKSERELGKLSGCTLTEGTPVNGLLRAARACGLRAYKKDLADFDDIRRLVNEERVPVIVDWFSTDEGHYSVVVGIDDENIHLQDPELGHKRSLRLETFRRVWFDFNGPYPRTPRDMVLRR